MRGGGVRICEDIIDEYKFFDGILLFNKIFLMYVKMFIFKVKFVF